MSTSALSSHDYGILFRSTIKHFFTFIAKLGWFNNVVSAPFVTVSCLSTVLVSGVREILLANLTSSSIGWEDLQMVHQL